MYKIKEFEKQLQEKNRKIDELRNICFDYVSAVYEMLSEFDDTSALTAFQKLALKRLKTSVDNHITSDRYKTFLQQRYIEKDSKALEKAVEGQKKEVEELLAEYNETFLRSGEDMYKYVKDDTETLNILTDE